MNVNYDKYIYRSLEDQLRILRS